MAEILVMEIRARRLSAAGCFFVEVRFGVTPVLLYFSPVPVPRQFAWRFNDLSCISTPRRPVIRLFFFFGFFLPRGQALARIFRRSRCSAHCFFSLFSIVLARADFLKPAQSLAL
jgi:hypothetical protein